MKISKIYISAFGGLKDYTLEFGDNMNVVFGENENGKSTIMAFIKAMFYGTGKNAQALEDNMRKRYTPWSGESMGGRIYFEHGQTRYMLERQFRKSNATDRVILTNLDTDADSAVESDIGKRFFGVSAAAFERSNFIGICALSSDETAMGELNGRLSNLVLSGDEDISYQAVLKRLETAKNKIISKTGKAGRFARLSEELSVLEEKRAATGRALIRKQELEARAQTLRSEYRALKASYDETKSVVDSEDVVRSAAKLKEYLAAKAQLDKLNESIRLSTGKPADDMFVRSVSVYINAYEQKAALATSLENDIKKEEQALTLADERNSEDIKQELDSYTEKKRVCEQQLALAQQEKASNESRLATAKAQYEIAKTAKKKFNPIFFFAASIMCAVACFIPVFAIKIGLFAVAVLLGIFGFVFRTNDKTAAEKLNDEIKKVEAAYNEKCNEIQTHSDQINVINDCITTLTAALNTDSALKEQRKRDIEIKKAELAEVQKAELAALEEVFTFFGRYIPCSDIAQVKDELSALTEKTQLQKEIKLRLSYLSGDLGGISYEQAEQKLAEIGETDSISDADLEAAKQRLEQLGESINAVTNESAAVLAELKTLAATEDTGKLDRQIADIKNRLSEQQNFVDAAEIALEVLTLSSTQVRRGYGAELEREALAIFSRLTKGRYKGISINRNFEIKVDPTDSFGTRELAYLSSGTADQAYLSLRLALIKMLSSDEGMPIFLDDALSQYDDRRVGEAIAFLKEYAENFQTVLFTCHSSISNAAKQSGINVISL